MRRVSVEPTPPSVPSPALSWLKTAFAPALKRPIVDALRFPLFCRPFVISSCYYACAWSAGSRPPEEKPLYQRRLAHTAWHCELARASIPGSRGPRFWDSGRGGSSSCCKGAPGRVDAGDGGGRDPAAADRKQCAGSAKVPVLPPLQTPTSKASGFVSGTRGGGGEGLLRL